MGPGNLTQPVKGTFVTPVTVAMDAPEPLEDQEIGLLKVHQAEQPLPEGKMVVKDPALLNPQDQLQGRIQGPKLGPLQDQPITDKTRAKKERIKAQGGEAKAITEIKAPEGQVIKAIGNVLPHKLVGLKGQKGPNLLQPQGNRPAP